MQSLKDFLPQSLKRISQTFIIALTQLVKKWELYLNMHEEAAKSGQEEQMQNIHHKFFILPSISPFFRRVAPNRLHFELFLLDQPQLSASGRLCAIKTVACTQAQCDDGGGKNEVGDLFYLVVGQEAHAPVVGLDVGVGEREGSKAPR